MLPVVFLTQRRRGAEYAEVLDRIDKIYKIDFPALDMLYKSLCSLRSLRLKNLSTARSASAHSAPLRLCVKKQKNYHLPSTDFYAIVHR